MRLSRAVRAPCCASVRAIAKPIAPVPPLTRATRPRNTEAENTAVDTADGAAAEEVR